MPPLIFLSQRVYLAGLCAILALGAAVSLWLSQQRAAAPVLRDYHVYQCATGSSAGEAHTSGSVFSLLTVSSIFAREIADNLCRSAAMARHYHRVQISWKPRSQLRAEEVLNEDYDLIWSRTHSLRGLVPEYATYYEPLLRYDQYKVYWFSRDQKPRLERDYFAGKKIGLLNDRLSHTFHLLPLASLKQVGVDISQQQLFYFDDAISLYRAFRQGELDLVSGGLFLEQDMDIPLQRTLLADNVTAATLFVRRARPAGIDCAIADAFDLASSGLFSAHRDFPGAHKCAGAEP
ncbi:hypothetical protein HXX02_03400 [Microbulbifer elongatus]|uniref:Solute-binding protein family 3/N-terminal domain-containing protein n=1 Tax=Microbulbifer elongatus TaxID=86173 RepID=A0ABT1P0H0_9GAMM|nr:hypothetical protein [Microbulbifer elongatus]MCQ3828479.1 hypothetical protein [Microbulbifer elongatus]